MNHDFLATTSLFRGVRPEELPPLLECLHAREGRYERGACVFHVGDRIGDIALVETGCVHVVLDLWWGDSQILGRMGAGETFAVSYAAIPGMELPFNVIAVEESEVLFVSLDHLLSTCERHCSSHRRLIHNLVRIEAVHNLALSARMTHIAPKTIRGRLLSYLSALATEQETSSPKIPFTRQQLADYLGVDRSALCHELSKMQADGLVRYRRNDVTLLVPPDSPAYG